MEDEIQMSGRSESPALEFAWNDVSGFLRKQVRFQDWLMEKGGYPGGTVGILVLHAPPFESPHDLLLKCYAVERREGEKPALSAIIDALLDTVENARAQAKREPGPEPDVSEWYDKELARAYAEAQIQIDALLDELAAKRKAARDAYMRVRHTMMAAMAATCDAGGEPDATNAAQAGDLSSDVGAR